MGSNRVGRLPSFLIIGAMKAGTTTLYRDMLAAMPGVYLPPDKEPEALTDDAVLSAEGRRRYTSLFREAAAHQICGEASTAYTKLPDYAGVPERAGQILGSNLKLVYLMRNPVDRLVSHYKHESIKHPEQRSIGHAIDANPSLIHYSCYAAQLEPWLERFGREAVLPIKFEDYVQDREATLAHVAEFLGVSYEAGKIGQGRAFNQSQEKPVVKGLWTAVYRSHLYRNMVRRHLSVEMRERLRGVLLPRVSGEEPVVAEQLYREIVERLQPDTDRLHTLLGTRAPTWDFTPEVDGS